MALSYTCWRWVFVVCVSLLHVVAGAADGVSVKCGPCQESLCPELHYCEGKAVKDRCGCCTVCSGSDKYQPHPLISNDDGDIDTRQGNACAKVKCPKFKVCMENMQGLPLCTCPGPFICKQRRSRQKPVCGTDGLTYQSRCYLRIAACSSATRIKVARRGPCTGAEGPRSRECDNVKSCRRRKNQHPVCGTDSKTYQSRCHMKIVACQKAVKIKLKHHGKCALTVPVGRGSLADQRADQSSAAVPGKISGDRQSADVKPRKKRRRRGKKKGGSDVSGAEVGKRKRRKQQRRDKRKKRLQRRRKRRKTRGQSRPRRYKTDRGQVLRNLGYNYWK